MNSLSEFWKKLNDIPEARVVFWISVTACLVVIGFYLVKRVRDTAIGGPEKLPSDHLSAFRELRDQGKIEEDEFRRLKVAVNKKVTPPKPVEFKEEPKPAESGPND